MNPMTHCVAYTCFVLLICVAARPSVSAQDANVTVVATPGQLGEAMRSGTQHIHITQHMDIRGLPTSERGTFDPILFYAPSNLSSLTVRTHLARQTRHAPWLHSDACEHVRLCMLRLQGMLDCRVTAPSERRRCRWLATSRYEMST